MPGLEGTGRQEKTLRLQSPQVGPMGINVREDVVERLQVAENGQGVHPLTSHRGTGAARGQLHFTPTSSTSKMSVALPGMTPLDPLAP